MRASHNEAGGHAFAVQALLNFQQLRSVREAARRGFNLTEVAASLHTSQPGVSRQIRELEDELGLEIFVRAGKRLTGLTAPGEALLPIVERLLVEADNLQARRRRLRAAGPRHAAHRGHALAGALRAAAGGARLPRRAIRGWRCTCTRARRTRSRRC